MQVKFNHLDTKKKLYQMLKDDDRLAMRKKLQAAAEVIAKLEKELAKDMQASKAEWMPSDIQAHKDKYGMLMRSSVSVPSNSRSGKRVGLEPVNKSTAQLGKMIA